MRALCGAIITAGGLIGLGLTALGIGTRYAYFAERGPLGPNGERGDLLYLNFKNLDTPLMMILVATLIASIIGLAIAFMGLAFHHERRHREMLLTRNTADGGSQLSAVP
jgi:hypothetical protein